MTPTEIGNMALARIGSLRMNTLDEGSVHAIQIRLHYEQTRDALLRSHLWQFAKGRKVLSEDTESPAFGWDNQFELPSELLRVVSIHGDEYNPIDSTRYSYVIEGNFILTDEDEVNLLYVKKVTDPNDFDPLFVEVLVLSLAVKVVMPLGGGAKMREALQEELKGLLSTVRTISKQESNTKGLNDYNRWIDNRISRRDPSRLS